MNWLHVQRHHRGCVDSRDRDQQHGDINDQSTGLHGVLLFDWLFKLCFWVAGFGSWETINR